MKRILVEKEKRKNELRKKIGDDKLVVSLVLIAVGVVLCFLYRTQVEATIKAAIKILNTKIGNMFGKASATVLLPGIINFTNMIKF